MGFSRGLPRISSSTTGILDVHFSFGGFILTKRETNEYDHRAIEKNIGNQPRLILDSRLIQTRHKTDNSHLKNKYHGRLYTLGVAPSQQKWQVNVLLESPNKHVIFLMVAVPGRGPYPIHTMV